MVIRTDARTHACDAKQSSGGDHEHLRLGSINLMPRINRQELTYEEAIFLWMADWQPDVRVLYLEKDGSWVRVDPEAARILKPAAMGSIHIE